MNAIKTYFLARKKKGQVEFGFVGAKWQFRILGGYTLMYPLRGGKEIAEKIAQALHKSILRCGHIDGTCRSVINKLTKLRTLADWQPDTDWWSNALIPGMESVKMIYVNQQPAVEGFGVEDLPVVEEETEPAAAEVLHNAYADTSEELVPVC